MVKRASKAPKSRRGGDFGEARSKTAPEDVLSLSYTRSSRKREGQNILRAVISKAAEGVNHICPQTGELDGERLKENSLVLDILLFIFVYLQRSPCPFLCTRNSAYAQTKHKVRNINNFDTF